MKAVDPNKITGIWSPGPGHRLPITLRTLARRDSLLRMAARCHFAGLSERMAAKAIAARLARYRSGSWRRDRIEATCPARHHGRLEEIFFALLKTKDAVPSERSIRRSIRGPRTRG